MGWKFRNLLICVLLLGSVNIAFSQQHPVAILVDEHGETACDESLGRMDTYFSELRNNPSGTGLVIISGRPENKDRSILRQSILEAHTKDRGFNAGRFRIARANSNEDLKVQYWLIAPGADEPEIVGLDMSYNLPWDMKPRMLGYESDVGGVCPEVDDAATFGAFLRANKRARGNVVIRDKSKVRALRRAARVLNYFVAKYGIRRSRLRTFIAKPEGPTNYYGPNVEYWYLP